MKTAAIIGEFNPFHNGHKLIIEKAREAGADRVVVLMSGDYVQRGAPAITDRVVRTEMALHAGADCILTYPTRFATSSAESFAYHAVDILNHLGCIDFLVFGSEEGSLERIMQCAARLTEESEDYKAALREGLKNGLSFPKARSEALPEFADLLESPNNILGVEYCKALLRTRSLIKPITYIREGSSYLDESSLTNLSSASAVRRVLVNGEDFPGLQVAIPKNSFQVLKKDVSRYGIVRAEDFSLLLIDRLWKLGDPVILQYFCDVTEELANTILKKRNLYRGFVDFADRCHSKSITVSHVSRALLHITLGIRNDQQLEETRVTQVLGFRRGSEDVVSMINKHADMKIIMNPAADRSKLSEAEVRLFDEETRVSNLYESIRAQKSGNAIRNVFTKELVKV